MFMLMLTTVVAGFESGKNFGWQRILQWHQLNTRILLTLRTATTITAVLIFLGKWEFGDLTDSAKLANDSLAFDARL